LQEGFHTVIEKEKKCQHLAFHGQWASIYKKVGDELVLSSDQGPTGK